MFDLLQIGDTLNQALQQTATTKPGETISFFDLIYMGGWIMIPLGVLLLLTVYVFAERYIAIRHASKIDDNFMNIIRDHIVSGNMTAARSFAKNTNNPVARIIDKGIQRIGKPIDAIESSMVREKDIRSQSCSMRSESNQIDYVQKAFICYVLFVSQCIML